MYSVLLYQLFVINLENHVAAESDVASDGIATLFHVDQTFVDGTGVHVIHLLLLYYHYEERVHTHRRRRTDESHLQLIAFFIK